MHIEASANVGGLVLHFRTDMQTMECVRSMVDEGIRIVVIVDNSNDEGRSAGRMRPALERMSGIGLVFEIVSPGRNLGFARGVNAGLMRVVAYRPDAVLLINSDAKLESGSLANLLRALDRAPLAIPQVRGAAGAAEGSLSGWYHRASGLQLGAGSSSHCVHYPSGCCLMLRTDIARAPLLDEDFFFYGEDVELGHELGVRGIGFAECSDAVIIHAGAGSARNGSLFYEYHINRGHWLLAVKLAGRPLERVLYIALRCVTLPLRASIRCLRFRSLTPWRGLAAASLDLIRGRCRDLTPPAA
jgi:N-acetylglucosaminyl-diphospho-decaprenol L-rhamnosyltransferase